MKWREIMVRFDPEVKSRLTQLGEEDSRSMSRELERPIDQECRRRGHPEPAPE
jgi:predicted transcriptional regulator